MMVSEALASWRHVRARPDTNIGASTMPTRWFEPLLTIAYGPTVVLFGGGSAAGRFFGTP
jgi:hypothetical protein